MSKRNRPRKNDKKHQGPQSHSAQQNENTPGKATMTVNPAPNNANKANTADTKPIPWWASWKNWKEVLEGIGIVAAILYALVTYLQWKDLRNNFIADERSWIKLGYTWPPLRSNQPAMINGELINIGKSPITFLYAEGVFDIVRSENPPSFSMKRTHSTHSEAPLFPSDHSPFPIALFNQTTKAGRAFTAEEIEGLQKGTHYAVVFGWIVYRDQFRAHWYRFCSWNSYASSPGTARAGGCVAWNRTGDDQPDVPIDQP